MAKSALMVGVDLGGTKIAAGLVSTRGKIYHQVRVASEAHTAKAKVIKNLERAISSCLSEGDARVIGIGCAGSVDPKHGVFRGGPNMPRDWKDVPLVSILRRRFHMPVIMENDANVIALAEQRWGKARGKSSACIITLGTGIGGGLLINGKLVQGAHHGGAEVGHMIISDRGIICACGKKGHFESFVGGKAMVNGYRRRTGRSKTTYEIVREARAGRRDACYVIQEMRQYLAIGIANVMRMFDPEVCILGGGLSGVPELVRGITPLVEPLLSHRLYLKPKIVITSLRHTAGILGGAALTMEPRV